MRLWKFKKGLKSSQLHLGLAPNGKGSVLGHVLHVDAVGLEVSASPHLGILLAVPLGEAKLLAHEDLCLPENLNLLLLRASTTSALNLSWLLTDRRICPILTLAAVPWALP